MTPVSLVTVGGAGNPGAFGSVGKNKHLPADYLEMGFPFFHNGQFLLFIYTKSKRSGNLTQHEILRMSNGCTILLHACLMLKRGTRAKSAKKKTVIW